MGSSINQARRRANVFKYTNQGYHSLCQRSMSQRIFTNCTSNCAAFSSVKCVRRVVKSFDFPVESLQVNMNEQWPRQHRTTPGTVHHSHALLETTFSWPCKVEFTASKAQPEVTRRAPVLTGLDHRLLHKQVALLSGFGCSLRVACFHTECMGYVRLPTDMGMSSSRFSASMGALCHLSPVPGLVVSSNTS
jgi:hypothetical protein